MATSPRKTPKSSSAQDRTPADTGDVTPPASMTAGGDYSQFVWQQLSQISQAVGRLEAQIESQKEMGKMQHDSLKSSIDGVKTRVDDLYALKNKVIGGAIVVGLVCSLLGFILPKIWDKLMAPNINTVSTASLPTPKLSASSGLSSQPTKP